MFWNHNDKGIYLFQSGQSTEMLVTLRASQEKNQEGQFYHFIFFTVADLMISMNSGWQK
jgi:hypothetical protein